MKIYDADGKCSPDSWSTCDLSSQIEYLPVCKAQSSDVESKKPKKLLAKLIFAWVKNQISKLASSTVLKNAVKVMFQEDIEFLNENFKYKCCLRKRHSSTCYRKWEKIEKIVENLVDEHVEEEKPIFKITKRIRPSKNLLLDKSQPFWVHSILVQSFFSSSHN